ncbi:MAG: SDR family NAD(P)-dependent oxidoreductase [Spirochaetia bacterium]
MSVQVLRDRSTLVVGGSGGIGAAVSLALADRGAKLRIHGGHDREALDSIVEQCADASGRRPEGILAPIGSTADVRQLVGDELPEVLVVAFGPIIWRGLAEHDADDWDAMATLNLAIPGALISACLPRMRERGFGRIVLFGASRGDTSPASIEAPAYTAAKAGLVSLVRSTGRYGVRHNIACNLVCPGYVHTKYLADEQRERFLRRSRSGHLTESADVAHTVLWLCGQERPVVTGAVINAGEGLI